MEEYHVAICDDESPDRERLMKLIRRSPLCPEGLIFYEYEGGEVLIEDYREFDAVFIDIGMKAMNGTETAQAVRKIDPSVLLAFYTGVEEYASRIVPVHPFAYLNKKDKDKVLSEELNFLIEEMLRRHQMPKLPVRRDGCLFLLNPSDILYISIRGKGSEVWLTKEAAARLHTGAECIKSNVHLTAYYEQLNTYGFIYAHKSYIINAEYVIMRSKNSIVLENGCELNIARSRQKEFDRELSAYLGIHYKRGERQ